jgi:ankyrin repeat protein
MNQAEVAASLVRSGARLDTCDFSGADALMKAVRSEAVDAARVLIEAGADVGAVDQCERTALMRASRTCNVEILELLLAVGADVALTDENGASALLYACAGSCVRSAELLLAAGASAQVEDEYALTPLMYAAHAGNGDLCRLLCENDARPDAVDERGRTALAWACAGAKEDIPGGAMGISAVRPGEEEYLHVVKTLIDCGADPNIGDNRGATALMHAAANGFARAVEELLLHGARASQPNANGLTVGDIVRAKGDRRIEEILRSFGS